MPVWSISDINILREYYPSGGSPACQRLLPSFTLRQIVAKAAKLGIRTTPERRSQRQKENQKFAPHPKRNVSEWAFIAPSTPEASYLLGLLWADGSLVNYSGSYRITIELAKDDLQPLLSIFETTGRWTIAYRNRINKKPQMTLTTSNKPLFCFLKAHGYKEKSRISAAAILSAIPLQLQRFWYRGLFDGDGCCYVNESLPLHQVSIAGSYNQEWDYLEALLKSLTITYSIPRRKQERSCGKPTHSSVVRFQGLRNIVAFGEYLYAERPDIGMARKRDSFSRVRDYYLKSRAFKMDVR